MNTKQAEAEARRIIYVTVQAELAKLKRQNEGDPGKNRLAVIEAMERIVEAELYDQAHNAHILAYYVSAVAP